MNNFETYVFKINGDITDNKLNKLQLELQEQIIIILKKLHKISLKYQDYNGVMAMVPDMTEQSLKYSTDGYSAESINKHLYF